MSFNSSLPVVEGEADFDWPAAGKPLKTWYRVIGELTSTSIPLFALHGGPGVGAESYNILSDITVKHGNPIVVYDQVGCKRSTHLQEKADAGEEFWNVDLFVAELHNLIRHLGLDADGRQYDILGHSWGAMFGSNFAAARPKGLRKYVIMSSAPSVEIWVAAQNILRKTLPQEIQDVMEKCEKEGRTESEEYQGAMMEYYARFLCRLDPVPDEIMDGLAELSKDPTMSFCIRWGPSEWYVTGTLKKWSVVDKIANINVPVLLLNGRYDEAQDSCMSLFFKLIPNVKWVQFANSAHMSHFEERERYMQVVGDFLSS